jgi:hypothetical protein
MMLLSLFLGVANIKTAELIITEPQATVCEVEYAGKSHRQRGPSKGNANHLIVECEMTNEFYCSPNNLP